MVCSLESHCDCLWMRSFPVPPSSHDGQAMRRIPGPHSSHCLKVHQLTASLGMQARQLGAGL